MAKKNLPNIPIYIGDWERDCNVLSLESEAAWMRIVFKLWTKGKQNTIKMPTKSLQNLWRCDSNKMTEILDDLIFNEIADIVITERFVEFTCRRFVKENELSEIRSKARKNDKSESNEEQNNNKTQSKHYQNTIKTETKKDQNTENDYEIESDYEIKTENVKKVEVQKIVDIYNSLCKNLPQVQKLTDQRKKAITARVNEYGLAKIGEVFQKVLDSPFLNGENDRGWTADFDWIMNPNNFIKILEGKYVKKNGQQQSRIYSDDFYRELGITDEALSH